jgi:hypothetical protein
MSYLDPGAGHAGTPDAQRIRDEDAAAARCFFSTCLDATGTRADSAFAMLPPALRDALTVGRPIDGT